MQVLLLKNLKSGRTWLPWESLPCQLGRSVLKNQELQMSTLEMHQDFTPANQRNPKLIIQGSHLGMEDEKVSSISEYYYWDRSHHTDSSCFSSVASLLTYLLSNQNKLHLLYNIYTLLHFLESSEFLSMIDSQA